LDYYHKSLIITEHNGDRHNAGIAYFNLGILFSNQGDKAQARIHFEKAKALYEIVGDSQWAQNAAMELLGL